MRDIKVSMLVIKIIITGIMCSLISVYAQENKSNIRTYKSGESIPIGVWSETREVTQKDVNNIRTYVAGDSIPIGNWKESKELLQKNKSNIKTYKAGDSIPLGNWKDSKENSIVPKSSIIPLSGALGDSITTHVGINILNLKEANGLISTNPAGLVGLFVIKAGVVYYFENSEPKKRKAGLKTTAGIWSGVTMHNLLLIAGASNPVGLIGGTLFGAYMYKKEEDILNSEN